MRFGTPRFERTCSTTRLTLRKSGTHGSPAFIPPVLALLAIPYLGALLAHPLVLFPLVPWFSLGLGKRGLDLSGCEPKLLLFSHEAYGGKQEKDTTAAAPLRAGHGREGRG